MAERPQRVTLTKSQCDTPAGRELVALLVELSSDGEVTHEEVHRLRSWLEVDRGTNFQACPFLHETIEQISSDGEITETELDQLALAIERVLPKDLRTAAALQRKERRAQKRSERHEAHRLAVVADRDGRRKARAAANAREGILYRRELAVRGAFRSSERRASCNRLIPGDTVVLEREPDSPHDPNAILVLGNDGCEVGYLPREEAVVMAPLLDGGAHGTATVARVWETPDGQLVPILAVKVTGVADRPTHRASPQQPERMGCGCLSAAVLAIFIAIVCVVVVNAIR